ncbi:MAG TPA: BrnT family toxin [Acidobacteriota bacterium]
MRFQYDPAKAVSNLKKHEVSFSDAEGVFYDPLAIHQVDPDSENEERFVAIGEGSAGTILVVVYTLRGEEVRLISARRATRHEVKSYEN